MTYRLISAFGLFVMIALAWGLSENRAKVNWRLTGWALALQLGLGLILFPTGFDDRIFVWVDKLFGVITTSSKAGAAFLFGSLTESFTLTEIAVEGAQGAFTVNATIAFHVLPIIIFVSCLAAILYHLRVIQAGVKAMSWLMARTLKTSGAETFGAALLVFLGVESMPTLRGYLQSMTRSELCTVMTVFMSTVAADVMVIYATFGAAPGHLLAASLMSAPAAILISKLMVPETDTPQTAGAASVDVPVESHNIFDAASRGASQGLYLALNVGAILIAFIALIALLNTILAALHLAAIETIFGWLFYPFAFLLGVPKEDIASVAQLLGTKTTSNEFIAYMNMSAMIENGQLQPRSIAIATYALCGFANPGSLGILLAALSGLIPDRRKEITELSIKSFIGGTLAVFMTACIAGMLIVV